VEGNGEGAIVVGVTVGDELGVVDGKCVGVTVLLELGGLVGDQLGTVDGYVDGLVVVGIAVGDVVG